MRGEIVEGYIQTRGAWFVTFNPCGYHESLPVKSDLGSLNYADYLYYQCENCL